MADAKCQGERAHRWMIVPEASTWLTKWKHMAREVGTADDPPTHPPAPPATILPSSSFYLRSISFSLPIFFQLSGS